MKTQKTLQAAAIVACMALVSTAALHAQTLIDVNFDAQPGNGQAVLGGTSDTYNNYSGSSVGSNDTATPGQTIIGDAVSSTGAATGVSLSTASGFKTYSNPGGTTANPSFLMDGYTYNSQAFTGSTNTSLSFGNLSAYDGRSFTLVIYGAGDTAGQGDTFALDGSLTPFGSTTGANRNITNGLGVSYQEVTGTITGSTLDLLVTPNDTSGSGGGPFTALDGLQLNIAAASAAAVPEPSTWAMMLGGLGLLIGFGYIRRGNQA